MMIYQLLRNIRERLTPLSGSLAQTDAEEIIVQSLNISRTRLYTDTSIIVDDNDLSRIDTIVERYISGEPLQYIFGKAYFYDREFFVSPDVLIPRADTETLVEAILNTEKDTSANFMDIGTGSGIIPIILTAHRPTWKALAVDISHDALRTAARNIYNDRAGQNISSDIILICCDMLSAVKPCNQFDFIVSNPPYISSAQIKTLDKNVVNYEPRAALHGGEDGLDYYHIISTSAKNYLKESGRVYLEIGYDQGESVPAIFENNGWNDIAVIKDLGGRDRVVTAVCNKK